MKRPSYYMLPVAIAVLVTFTVSGHLHVDRTADLESETALLHSSMEDEQHEPPLDGVPEVADGVVGTGAAGREREPVAVQAGSAPPRLVMQDLAGTVLDAMGYLLVGAEVGPAAEKVRTDSDGQFALQVAARDAMHLRISANGCRDAFTRVMPLAREPLFVALEPSAPWDQAVEEPAAPLFELHGEGFARDEAGQPLVGAHVIVAETGVVARIDEVGRYRIALPDPADGAVTLVLHAPIGDGPGLVARSEPFVASRRSGVVPSPDLVGLPGAQVRGTVRGPNGEPVRGVPLTIVAGDIVRTIASGEGGSFRLAGLPAGRAEVRAFAFRGALGRRVVFDIDQRTESLEIHLRSTGKRRLRVVDESGDPVASAIVATSYEGMRRGVARADEDGWVQLRAAVEEADYEVRAGADYMALRVIARPTAADELVVAAP